MTFGTIFSTYIRNTIDLWAIAHKKIIFLKKKVDLRIRKDNLMLTKDDVKFLRNIVKRGNKQYNFLTDVSATPNNTARMIKW